MVVRQERDLRRDGALFLLGLAGLIIVEVVATSGPATVDGGVIHEFIFGCSVGILLSGIFRATDEGAVVSTLAFGVGFALRAVIGVF